MFMHLFGHKEIHTSGAASTAMTAANYHLRQARAHLGRSPEVEYPGLGRKILPEAVMLFLVHDPEPYLFYKSG
jgi:hypothetical protein